MKNAIFPMFGASQFKNILVGISNLNGGSVTIDELAESINLKKSSLGNHFPIIKELGLIIKTKQRLYLSHHGFETVKSLKNNDITNLIGVFNNIKNNSLVISFADSIISTNPDIDERELGEFICDKFKKERGKDYYKKLGRSAKDIVRFFKTGDTVFRIRPDKNEVDCIRPSGTYNTLIENRLHEAFNNSEFIIDKSNEPFNQREYSDLNNLLSLNLLERIGERKYQATKKGIQMLNSTNKKEYFADILMGNEILKPLFKAINGEKTINKKVIGTLFMDVYDLEVKESTALGYGKKFLNWIKESGLIESVGKGNYMKTSNFYSIFQFYLSENYNSPESNLIKPNNTLVSKKRIDNIEHQQPNIISKAKKEDNEIDYLEILRETHNLLTDLKCNHYKEIKLNEIKNICYEFKTKTLNPSEQAIMIWIIEEIDLIKSQENQNIRNYAIDSIDKLIISLRKSLKSGV